MAPLPPLQQLGFGTSRWRLQGNDTGSGTKLPIQVSAHRSRSGVKRTSASEFAEQSRFMSTRTGRQGRISSLLPLLAGFRRIRSAAIVHARSQSRCEYRRVTGPTRKENAMPTMSDKHTGGFLAAAILLLACMPALGQAVEPVLALASEGKAGAARDAERAGVDRVRHPRPRRARQARRPHRRTAQGAGREGRAGRATERHYKMDDTPEKIGRMVHGDVHRHRHEEDPADRAHGHRLSARHARAAAVPHRRRPRLRPRHRRRPAGRRRHPARARDPEGASISATTARSRCSSTPTRRSARRGRAA